MKRAVFDSHCLKRIHQYIPSQRLRAALRTRVAGLSPLSEIDGLDANGLWQLLDCLVYLDLGASPITERAVAVVKKQLPTLTGRPVLPSILSSCYQLGQNDVALQFAPYLREVIRNLHTADDICKLSKALAAAGMTDPDLWQLIAERAIRTIQDFSGPLLFELSITLLERKVEYVDYFAVVDRHITDKEPDYMTAAMLRELITWYRRKSLSTVNLAVSLASRVQLDDETEGSGGGTSGNGEGRYDPPTAGAKSQDVLRGDQVVKAFIAGALKNIPTATIEAVLELLRDCVKRQVLSADVLQACLRRVRDIHEQHDDGGQVAGGGGVRPVDAMTALSLMALFPSRVIEQCGLEAAAVCDCAVEAIHAEPIAAIKVAARLLRAGHAALIEQAPFTKKLLEVLQPREEGGKYGGLSHDRIDAVVALTMIVAMSKLGPEGSKVLCHYSAALRTQITTVHLRRAEEVATLLSAIPELGESVLQPFFASLKHRNWKTAIGPYSVLNFLEAMHRSRIRDAPLVLDCVQYASQAVGAYNCQQLCSILTLAAMLGYKDIDWYGKMVRKAASLDTCGVSELCTMLHMLALVGPTAAGLAAEVIPRIRVSVKLAKAQDVVFALYAMASLGQGGKRDAIEAFCERLVAVVDSMTCDQILSCLGSMRKLKERHSLAVSAACTQIMRASAQLTPQSLVRSVILLVDADANVPPKLAMPFLNALLVSAHCSSAADHSISGKEGVIGSKLGFEALIALGKLIKWKGGGGAADEISRALQSADGVGRMQLLASVRAWDSALTEVASQTDATPLKKPSTAGSVLTTPSALVELVASFATVFGVSEQLPPNLERLVVKSADSILSSKPLQEALRAAKKLQLVAVNKAKDDDKGQQGSFAVDAEAVKHLDGIFGSKKLSTSPCQEEVPEKDEDDVPCTTHRVDATSPITTPHTTVTASEKHPSASLVASPAPKPQLSIEIVEAARSCKKGTSSKSPKFRSDAAVSRTKPVKSSLSTTDSRAKSVHKSSSSSALAKSSAVKPIRRAASCLISSPKTKNKKAKASK